MAGDSDWVADVRRWCQVQANPGAPDGSGADASHAEDDGAELGYEAAQPALLARHWPDAPGH